MCDALFHARGVEEAVAETVFDSLVEDADVLLLPFVVEVAVGLGEGDIFHNVVPKVLHTLMGVGRAEHHFNHPLRVGHRKEVEGIAVLGSCKFGLHGVDVALVDGYHVRHLHNAAFDALKLVARVGELE